MTIYYGKTMTIGGATISVTGYTDKLDAEIACWRSAIQHGHREPPLRQKWWQFWRATKHPKAYLIALREYENA